MSPSRRDEQDQSHQGPLNQEINESDPLLPRPITAGDSIVEGLPSPLESTITQLSVGESADQTPESAVVVEEDTLVWSRDKMRSRQREAITTPFWRGELEQTIDLESTDEWIAPRVSPLIDVEVPEKESEDVEALRASIKPSFKLLSTVDRQLYQVTVATPAVGGKRGVILPLSIAAIASIFYWGEGGSASAGSVSSFGLSWMSLSVSLFCIICLSRSLWASRQQQLSVNQARVNYRIRLLGKTISALRFPLSELQEVSLSPPSTEPGPERYERITLIGKVEEISFGAHLPQEERRHLFELIREKVVDLQQGIFR